MRVFFLYGTVLERGVTSLFLASVTERERETEEEGEGDGGREGHGELEEREGEENAKER